MGTPVLMCAVLALNSYIGAWRFSKIIELILSIQMHLGPKKDM
jgi:hypothetical protein